MTHRSLRRGRVLLGAACVVGLVHAGASLYWACGGRRLLDTVGKGAVDLGREHPIGTAMLLLPVTAIKLAGSCLPLAVERPRYARFRRVIRLMAWIGGSFLVVYGTTYALLSAAVLHGVVHVPGEIDRLGMQGHAYLWDPLFAFWGLALVSGLWWTRQPGTVPDPDPPAAAPTD